MDHRGNEDKNLDHMRCDAIPPISLSNVMIDPSNSFLDRIFTKINN